MSFTGLLNQPVTAETSVSKNRYGQDIPGAPKTYSARVQIVNKTRLSPSGDAQQIDATIMIAGDPGLNINDYLDYLGTRYRIVTVKKNDRGQWLNAPRNV